MDPGRAERWGVAPGYHDVEGVWRPTTPEASAAILAAMGVEAEAPAPAPAPVRVVRAGARAALEGPADLVLEDGTRLDGVTALPPDLPSGYHELRPRAGGAGLRLIVTPGPCYLPESLRAWGWAVQLYALHSETSWGIGDLGDLARLASWSAGALGAGLLLVNPLGAAAPTLPQAVSPYSPSSRRFLNPLYLAVEAVPGAREATSALEPLAVSARALSGATPIDRDRVFRLKTAALERLWTRWRGDRAFDRYRRERGRALEVFAAYCVLAERHGPSWRAWPPAWRRPDDATLARVARQAPARLGFHAWLQWLLERQLAAAAGSLRLVHDLPVGFDPDGADAWAWQDLLATGASVGSPPDTFNARGQDWGLPPFVPHRLRAAAYGPLVETLRAVLRPGGGVRIDHVMGLFRLFWVPWGQSPAGGAYVRYPAEELLGVLALESQRARAVIVGEDLGTVEDSVRRELAERRVLSYRLLWFEAEPPRHYPRQALAAVTTHDLPTIAGIWTGADLESQRAAGVTPSVAPIEALRARLAGLAGCPEGAPLDAVAVGAHRALAEAPSMLLAATLEDALLVTERPNLPGTTTERPNWALPLPLPLEAIECDPVVRRVAGALGARESSAPG
jgi:4-alpha-glucanotransferase